MTMPDTSFPPQPQTPAPTSTDVPPRSSAREQVREIKDQAIGQARETFRDARDRAASSLGDSKSRMADQIGGMASAFRHASEQFRSDDQARIAGLAESVASQVDQLADYLRNRDGRAMLDDIDRLARRQPALVIGGAFALGLLAARFIKSSERRERMAAGDAGSGYGAGSEYGSGDGGLHGD
jgi:hypothetical protein